MAEDKICMIFIVEPDKVYSFMLNFKLQHTRNFKIISYKTGGQCVNNLYKKPDIIILDQRELGTNTEHLLSLIKERSPKSFTILLTEFEDQLFFQKFIRANNFKFLIKDKDSTRQADILIQSIMSSIEREKLRSEKATQKQIVLFAVVVFLLIVLALFLSYNISI